jgi:tetratricopeptide (TPR) repeat protein
MGLVFDARDRGPLMIGSFGFMLVKARAFQRSARCRHVSRLQTPTNVLVALVSQAALEAWRKIIGVVGLDWRPRPEQGSNPELRYLRAMACARADTLEASERRFAELLEAHPTSFYAMEEHGRILDRMRQRDAASAKYELARSGRQLVRRGMPDRPFFMRHRTTSVAEIDGYTNVLRAGASKKGVLAYLARGHAYLATRRPRLALLDYNAALRLAPDQTALLLPIGEALAALGRHGEALQVLDRAVAERARDPEPLSSRAFVHLALGRLAQADADWFRQLELLPPERHDARACVLLRLANYEMALNELERAIERNPGDPYLHLYYLTSVRRLGRSAQPRVAPMDIWPGPLIALHNGKLCARETLQRADNQERRAEALFQLGICAYEHDREEAGRLWRQVVEIASPDTIEYATARHEVERLRAQSVQLESAGRTVPCETNIAHARESDQMEPRAVPSDRALALLRGPTTGDARRKEERP